MSNRLVDSPANHGWSDAGGGKWTWNVSGSGGAGAGMVISETEPTDKVEGMQWLNPTTGLVLFWDGEKWLEMPGGVDGADGKDGVDGLWTDNGDTSISYNAGNVGIGNHSFRPDGGIFSKFDSGDTSDIHFGAIAGVSNGFQIIQSADNKLAYNFTSAGAYSMTIDGDGRVDITGSLYVNGTPKIGTKELIETLSTLRNATKDETTVKGLRDAIGNAVGGLIEKFEAMQKESGDE